MEMVTAYLGLGSNLGDRLKNLQDASELLDTLDDGVRVLRSSNVYETEPWGLADQPRFLNCILEITCAVSPDRLLGTGQAGGANFGPGVEPPLWAKVDGRGHPFVRGHNVVEHAGPSNSPPADGANGLLCSCRWRSWLTAPFIRYRD